MERDAGRPDISRRAFLGTAGTAALAVGLWAGLPKPAEADIKQRKFGRTGYMVTEPGFGAIRVTDRSVVDAAIDRGINLVHTCAGYTNGQSYQCVGQVMATKRDKVFLALKVWPDPDTLKQQLQVLKTDHVDAVMPPFEDPAGLSNQRIHEAFAASKAQGLVKYFGFACHKNMAAVVSKAAELGCFDCALIGYSPANKAEVGPAIAAAAKAGIGVSLMKWKAGDAAQSYQTMIADPNVSSILCSAGNTDQLDQYLKVAALAPSEDRDLLRRQERMACAMCGACERACPRGVAAADIMRFRYYAERGDRDLARAGYASLAASRCALNCNECGACERVCSNGLPVIERLRETHQRLA